MEGCGPLLLALARVLLVVRLTDEGRMWEGRAVGRGCRWDIFFVSDIEDIERTGCVR